MTRSKEERVRTWAGRATKLFGGFKFLPLDVLGENGTCGGVVPEDGWSDDGHGGFEVSACADPDGSEDADVGVDLGVAIDPCGGGEAVCALDGGGGRRPVGHEAVDELGDFVVVSAIEDFAIDAGDLAFITRDLAAE